MLQRDRIVFDKGILFKNVKRIIDSIAKNNGRAYTLPTQVDGFFEHQFQLVTASLSDILRPLLYGEPDPVETTNELAMSVSLYSTRQHTLLPAVLEQYICNTIAYAWFVNNGYGYNIIDMETYYNKLHHAVLLKDKPYSRTPGF